MVHGGGNHERCSIASERTILEGSAKPPRLSTPWALTSFESASAPISAAFPLITVGCHASNSSRKYPEIFPQRTRKIRNQKCLLAAIARRKLVAPTPTGSNTTGLPFLVRVAARGDHPVERVHGSELMSRPPGMRARIGLFRFGFCHDGRPTKSESDVGGLRLDHVVCNLGVNGAGFSEKTKRDRTRITRERKKKWGENCMVSIYLVHKRPHAPYRVDELGGSDSNGFGRE